MTGRPPATIVLLGGDVHNAYVTEVALGTADDASRVFQIVCSPYRNRLASRERRIIRLTGSKGAALVFSFLARLAGVPPPSVGWRFVRRPSFDNSIGELQLDGRSARVTLHRSGREGESADVLHLLHATELRSDADARG